MLHKCAECNQIYLVSPYLHLCDTCGSYIQQRVERLYEKDEAVEWWVICARAMFGGGNEQQES